MSYELEYKSHGYFLTHKGMITIGEISEANGAIQGHSDFDKHSFQLINLLAADFSEIDEVRARMPGATDSVASRMRKNVKLALVATEKKAVRFCEEYIETAKRHGTPWEFKIFPDTGAALAWVED